MVVPPRLGMRGVCAIVTTREAGCDGRGRSARKSLHGRLMLARTAKPCGPDTPTLVSSWRDVSPMTGARKPGPRGEHGISRNPLAQGRPGCPAKPVVTAACFFCCTRAMGAACTRPSLRPHDLRGPRLSCKARTHRAARMRPLTLFRSLTFESEKICALARPLQSKQPHMASTCVDTDVSTSSWPGLSRPSTSRPSKERRGCPGQARA
jgi:hypothetical protein